MSISYVDDISDGQGIFIFAKILGRWKGSLYKLVWIDLLIYIMAYYILNLSYRFAMNEDQKRIFEQIVNFCERTKGDIPISFLLGFFVAGIISRWYQMYIYIPWMNQIAMHISACVNGRDCEGSRRVRLTVMRYLNLSWVMLMRLISDQINCRFVIREDEIIGSRRRLRHSQKPKLHRNTFQPWSIDAGNTTKPNATSRPASVTSANRHSPKADQQNERSTNCALLSPTSPISCEAPGTPSSADDELSVLPDAFEAVDDGSFGALLRSFNNDEKVKHTFGKLITESEIEAFEQIALASFRRTRKTYVPEYWVPIQWAQRLILKALLSGYIVDPKTAYITVGEIGRLRQRMQSLQVYSSIMIPLVYTQVVIIAVYSYFLCQIFASQFVERAIKKDETRIDLYIPIFSIFSFLFLMGWLKVALCVMNPFGDDDEDFQTSDILDYNLEVSYRSTVMDDFSFPKNMSMPLMFASKPPPENDDLQPFLEETHAELSEVKPSKPANDVANLEIQPPICVSMKNCGCCRKQKNPTPQIIVTNCPNQYKRPQATLIDSW